MPALCGSIEIARDRMFAKFQCRPAQGNHAVAFMVSAVEAAATLPTVRRLCRAVRARVGA